MLLSFQEHKERSEQIPGMSEVSAFLVKILYLSASDKKFNWKKCSITNYILAYDIARNIILYNIARTLAHSLAG